MSLPVVCSQCGKSHDVPDIKASQVIECSCGASVAIQSDSRGDEQPNAPGSSIGSVNQSAAIARPSQLTTMIVLIDISSILAIPGAILGTIIMMSVAMHGGSFLGWMLLLISLFSAVLYVGILVVCHFLWNGYNKARLTMVVLMSLISAIGLWSLIQSTGSTNMLVNGLQLFIDVLFICILNMKSTKEYCCK